MQQAVLQHYPDVSVRYQFTNRRKTNLFSRQAYEWIVERVMHMSSLRLTEEELQWLRKTCGYFTASYLDWLAAFRFDPSNQVEISFQPSENRVDGDYGGLHVRIFGRWVDTILYEVPIMSIISQAYFTFVDVEWDYVGQRQNAYSKADRLLKAGCVFTEFGTRRRRTYLTQKIVMQGLTSAAADLKSKEGYSGALTGTSNVHFAMLFGVPPIGTIAHEWTMGIAAKEGYEGANSLALDKWDQTYPGGQLDIALTDTFSTRIFLAEFVKNPARARRWKGLRQDSGDPKVFAEQVKVMYEGLGIKPNDIIVFSDGLDVDRCIDLKQFSDRLGIRCSFGVGTTFTNDFKKVPSPQNQADNVGEGAVLSSNLPDSKALNVVIKLWEIDGQACVKISDELTKNSGDPEAVKLVKSRFGLEG